MAKTTEEKVKTDVQGVKTVKVKLPRIKGAEDPVFVSVNDYTCYIKRGVEVEVPDYVAEVLEHSEKMLDVLAAHQEASQWD